MVNFKSPLAILGSAWLFGCTPAEAPKSFFNLAMGDHGHFQYTDIHQLKLHISEVKKTIDETGFSPVFIGNFQLENAQHGPWEKAWVAFEISILVKNVEITSIKRAGVLQNYQMNIQIQHDLPKFGIKTKDIQVKVKPIAWMPSYPLIIASDTEDKAATTP